MENLVAVSDVGGPKTF